MPSRGVLLLAAGLLAVAGTHLQLQHAATGAAAGGTCSNGAAGAPPFGWPGLHLNVLHCAALALLLWAMLPSKPRVFVVNFAVLHPPASWAFPRSAVRELAERAGRMLPEHIDFLDKVVHRTGLGDETAVVPAIQGGDRTLAGVRASRQEFEECCFPPILEALDKAGVKPTEVDFVITNSSLFNPTPSLSALVMNHLKMRRTARGYSLGGMGCSAGVIALDLAKELLELHPNSVALVVSHENISNAYYTGKDPSMLLANCLFRANGAAVVMSNKPKHAARAKYLVRHVVRTNLASDDVAYYCVQQTQDEERKTGVKLNKDIVQVGTRALQDNMTSLGPLVLPVGEQLRFAGNWLLRRAIKTVPALKSLSLPPSLTKPYTPDFKKAFDRFCIHTGGRGIIDGLEKELSLSRAQVEPSRASLYRYGNTSSTSIWYELAYMETRQTMPAGSRVWQLAFGSGFKFNSAVLVATRKVAETHKAWEVFDVAGMWAELDKLEAAARAARAAKAQRLADEAAAAAAAAAAPAAASDAPATAAVPDPPSAFAQAVAIAKDLPDGGPADAARASDQAPRLSVRFAGGPGEQLGAGAGSMLRRGNSLMAVGSGVVSAADIDDLEDEDDDGDEKAQ